MSYYFSAEKDGFYNSKISGERFIEIPDPDWVGPVEDGSAPPLVLVPNEECTLPDDAVPVTDEQYPELLAAKKAQRRLHIVDGQVVVGEYLFAFDDIRKHQKGLIDEDRLKAENTEFTFIHNGISWDAGKNSEYRLMKTLRGAEALGALPPGFYWTDADNVNHFDITISQLQELQLVMEAKMFEQGFLIHQKKGQLFSLIDAAPDEIDAIRAIKWPVE